MRNTIVPKTYLHRSGYSVETIERLFRRFRQVDTADTSSNGSSIQAVSATNQLLVIRERLQAGLSARLLELKMEMDKEFGIAFVDMESYLRTEKGAAQQLARTTNSGALPCLFPLRPSPAGGGVLQCLW